MPHPPVAAGRAALRVVTALLVLALLPGCDRAPDPGLVRAPGFADENGRLAAPWRFAHHASTDSYRLVVDSGVATIERTGHEPWAMLVQPVPQDLIPELAGRRLAFSMELRAELENETFGPPLKPTALTVQMWHEQRGGGALGGMLGPRQAETARLDLPSAARITDWTRHTLEFTAPDDLSKMEIAVMMTSGGRLQLRRPALHPLDP
jgi:hypothetical protein